MLPLSTHLFSHWLIPLKPEYICPVYYKYMYTIVNTYGTTLHIKKYALNLKELLQITRTVLQLLHALQVIKLLIVNNY
jgi:hypothetical protein